MKRKVKDFLAGDKSDQKNLWTFIIVGPASLYVFQLQVAQSCSHLVFIEADRYSETVVDW